MPPTDARADAGYRPRRRPGTALLVLSLHLLLVAGMWHAMARREVEVRPTARALTWVRPLTTSPSPPPRPAAAPSSRAKSPTARPQPPARETPREAPVEPTLTWVAPPAVAAAEPASAPASAPPERLLDTAATRAALRELGRRPLMSERAAAATGRPIERTDTALAQATAEAAKPDCLRDGKAATGQIGPVGVGGILGLPFLAARAVTGGCAK